MAQGRSAELQRFFDLEVGDSINLYPAAGEAVPALLKRIKQLTYLYLRQGKAYRLEDHDDYITAKRVPIGSHRKLSVYTDLKCGERVFIAPQITWKEAKSLLGRLERLRDLGRGTFWAEEEHDGIYVRCHAEAGSSQCWNNEREFPMPKFLTRARR